MITPIPQLSGEKHELAKMGILPAKPQKLIVLVHGGPKERDYAKFNAANTWLTSRGYALLQVYLNF